MKLNTNISVKGLDLSHLCSFLGQKCLISADELTLNIINNNALLDRAGADDIELLALTEKVATVPHCYNVVVRTNLDRQSAILVICHEFIHISQMESERFVCDYHNRYFEWEGKEVSASITYGKRPWEIEAFKRDIVLAREYRRLQ